MIPKPLTLRKEDYKDAPDWVERLFAQLNDWFSVATPALTGGLLRSENLQSRVKTIAFTTEPVAADTFPLTVKTGLAQRVADAWLGRLRKTDGSDITDAYSFTWEFGREADEITVRFQGLEAATRYEARIVVE